MITANPLTLLNLVSELKTDVPVLVNKLSTISNPMPGAAIGIFTGWLYQLLLSNSSRPSHLQQGIDFLNRMADSGSAEIKELLCQEVFIGLFDLNPKSLTALRPYLNTAARKLLDTQAESWGFAA